MESNCASIDFRRVSDLETAYQLTFEVAGIIDNRYNHTMGETAISLRICLNFRENIGCTSD
jgi:hypothetical protein